MLYMKNSIVMLILVIILNMMSVAFFTLYERKVMGIFHYRKGPNKVAIFGIMQPFSDAIKLLNKQSFYPTNSNMYMYMLAPLMMFSLVMVTWLIYPFMTNLIAFNLSFLYFISTASMSVYGLMMMGWSSNSSYSMLGAIRSMAQSISYEVTLSINILIVMILIDSLDLNNLYAYSKYIWLAPMMIPIMTMILISMLAEINRTPFDFSEGESELVSGFNVEFGEVKFTIIFLAEYSSISLMMFMFTLLFFNSNLMSFKFYLMWIMMIFFITWIRMTFPRLRYDKLMNLCWYYILPITLINFLIMMLYVKLPLMIL